MPDDLLRVVEVDTGRSDSRLAAAELSARAVEIGKRDGSLGTLQSAFLSELAALQRSAVADVETEFLARSSEGHANYAALTQRVDQLGVELVGPHPSGAPGDVIRRQVLVARLEKARHEQARAKAGLDSLEKLKASRIVALTAQFEAIAQQYLAAFEAARVAIAQRQNARLRHRSWFVRWYTPWRRAPREVARYVGVAGQSADADPQSHPRTGAEGEK